eukprot:CAMPEP_0168823030 /NCGR_PEP_ID=MMETSP0726-20121227/10295_1 /TAXON_ID=265536 /ORGANISM="Amphiprora sp., Strain CCMP467" /LENGTH=36 /DNA_ID= /DNA_START= /DNA_END= /DNA_ORIENTATION=
MATVRPLEDMETDSPERSKEASPSISSPNWTQLEPL